MSESDRDMYDRLGSTLAAAVEVGRAMDEACHHRAERRDETFSYLCPCGLARVQIGDVPGRFGERNVPWGEPGYGWRWLP